MAVSKIPKQGFVVHDAWLYSADLDTIKSPGMYMIGTSSYRNWSVLVVLGNGSDTIRQFVIEQNSITTRSYQAGAWGSWRVLEEHAAS